MYIVTEYAALNEQNIYAICKNMLFSTHIDVFKSCLGLL